MYGRLWAGPGRRRGKRSPASLVFNDRPITLDQMISQHRHVLGSDHVIAGTCRQGLGSLASI